MMTPQLMNTSLFDDETQNYCKIFCHNVKPVMMNLSTFIKIYLPIA